MEDHSTLQPAQLLIRRLHRALRADGRVPHPAEPLNFYQGGPRLRRLLYFTQDEPCVSWFRENKFPTGWHVLSRYTIPTESYLETIRRYAANARLPFMFVGDLNPHNLAVFAALRLGNTDFRFRKRDEIPIQYLGIDDRWYQLCLDHLKPGEELVTLELTEPEKEKLRLLRELFSDLRDVVGPKCAELLLSGRQFPIGAATSLGFYDASFDDRLIAHLNRAPGRSVTLRKR